MRGEISHQESAFVSVKKCG